MRSWRLDVPARGTAELVWDGRDAQGAPVPSGVYLARIRTRDGERIRRVSLVK